MEHLDFLRERIGGSNWVLGRRSAAIVRRYGEDVICVSRQRYKAIEREYRALYGDPNDRGGAAMYIALLGAKEELAACGRQAGEVYVQVCEAIDGERNAR